MGYQHCCRLCVIVGDQVLLTGRDFLEFVEYLLASPWPEREQRSSPLLFSLCCSTCIQLRSHYCSLLHSCFPLGSFSDNRLSPQSGLGRGSSNIFNNRM